MTETMPNIIQDEFTPDEVTALINLMDATPIKLGNHPFYWNIRTKLTMLLAPEAPTEAEPKPESTK